MSEDEGFGLSLWNAARAMGVAFAEEAEPLDREVVANGLRLHYLDWGNPQHPPMLLLHGRSQTAHSWDFVALALRDTHHVIALDQRGHGDSDWATDGDYSLEAHRRDIQGFVEALGLGRFVMVGLSMGGRNAWVYASHHPEQVTALVIVDAGPQALKLGQQRIRHFVTLPDELDSYEEFVERVHQFNPRRSLEQIRGSLKHNVKRAPNGKWTWKYDKVFRDARGPVGRPSEAYLRERLRLIPCPTLIVRGGESDILAPEMAQEMLQIVPRSRLATVPGAGHLVPGDNPAGFVGALREFLDAPG